MRIEYSEHLKSRLGIKKIPRSLPEKVLREADDYFYDTATKLLIAVKEITSKKQKPKSFMVAFIRNGDTIRLITIHPLKCHQKINRDSHLAR